MATVTWTIQAIEDLDAICLFIARDAIRPAEMFAERVFRAAEQLGHFPLSGRAVPEIGSPDIREVFVGNYRLIYRVASHDEVEVLTIHHGARLLGDL